MIRGNTLSKICMFVTHGRGGTDVHTDGLGMPGHRHAKQFVPGTVLETLVPGTAFQKICPGDRFSTICIGHRLSNNLSWIVLGTIGHRLSNNLSMARIFQTIRFKHRFANNVLGNSPQRFSPGILSETVLRCGPCNRFYRCVKKKA